MKKIKALALTVCSLILLSSSPLLASSKAPVPETKTAKVLKNVEASPGRTMTASNNTAPCQNCPKDCPKHCPKDCQKNCKNCPQKTPCPKQEKVPCPKQAPCPKQHGGQR